MSKDNLPPHLQQALQHLDMAEALADVGLKEPVMAQYPSWCRPLARWAARRVLHASQLITIQQRQFNHHVLESIRLLAGTTPDEPMRFGEHALGADGLTALTETGRQRLMAFLAGHEALDFATGPNPALSVLLVLHNRAELTFLCLQALRASTCRGVELVIVDNASSDLTARLLDRITGAVVIRNASNRHFLEGANQAAAAAHGAFLLFLNNDAIVDADAIEAALASVRQDPAIGVVGAKLIHPTGMLQEAGGIIWRDGSCQGYGRGENHADPPFAWRRQVDYVSGAFLLTPAELFRDLGGFDPAYAPAYCEDEDYCLRVAAAGRKVIYEPLAEVLHVEGASSLADAPNIGRQLTAEHCRTIRERHRQRLQQQHLPHEEGLVQRARTRCEGVRRVLVIDDRVPHAFLGSGFPRTREMVEVLADQGHAVTFYPMRFPQEGLRSAYTSLSRRIEVAPAYGVAGLERFLSRRGGAYDVLIVGRPHNLDTVARLRHGQPALFENLRLIYDAEAVFALREAEQERTAGRTLSPATVQQRVAAELAPALEWHAVLAVSDQEAAVIRTCGVRQVVVVPHAVTPRPSPPGFGAREGFLFVGPALEETTPNADAITWLVTELFPAIRRRLPQARLTVAGQIVPPRLRQLLAEAASDGVTSTGQLPDLQAVYDRARVFIAPTRFAAGIPLKVLDACAAGLPAVMTSLLARQLDWQEEAVSADTVDNLAKACCGMHEDAVLWSRTQAAAQRSLTMRFSRARLGEALKRVLSDPDA